MSHLGSFYDFTKQFQKPKLPLNSYIPSHLPLVLPVLPLLPETQTWASEVLKAPSFMMLPGIVRLPKESFSFILYSEIGN